MSKKILILDADEKLRVLLTASLEVKGYSVTTSDNGIDGFRLLRRDPPNLLILEAGLPRMSGYEVISKLRTLTDDVRKIPIIVTSEKASMKELFGPADIHAFFLKPLLPAMLMKSIAEALKKDISSSGSSAHFKKNIFVLGMDDEVKDTLRQFFAERGYQIHDYLTEMKVFMSLQELRPLLILSQYSEEPEGFNLPTFCNNLAKNPATSHFTCRVLCPMKLIKQADKEFVREALIMYTKVDDITAKIEPFLK